MAEAAIATTQLTPISRSWEADFVDTARIQATLEEMWTSWHDRALANRDPAEGSSDTISMRPSTLNLIVATDTVAAADEAIATIDTVADIQPSRTILVHDAGNPDTPDQFHIELVISERPYSRHRSPVSLELIRIAAAPGHGEQLASAISPLLLPDLPDILYVPGNSLSENGLALELIKHVDGLLYDSALSTNSAADLAYLAALAVQDGAPALADMAWYRIGPWRQWTAQFFDPPAMLPHLDVINDLAICYGDGDGQGRNGMTAALLMASWIATRLNWRAPGELVPDDLGWKSTLRAGPVGKNREILLNITSGGNGTGGNSLECVHLKATRTAPAAFQIERIDESTVSMTTELPELPGTSRMIFHKMTNDSAILGEILKFGAVDPLYLEALLFAATLWPIGSADA